mmetsp:Transcript_57087/g.158052  ORF Transcript_57087/g.158052 Transcript_57087/m.158052 type:complete len:202 (-) Transcript_57087:744-1349(-)
MGLSSGEPCPGNNGAPCMRSSAAVGTGPYLTTPWDCQKPPGKGSVLNGPKIGTRGLGSHEGGNWSSESTVESAALASVQSAARLSFAWSLPLLRGPLRGGPVAPRSEKSLPPVSSWPSESRERTMRMPRLRLSMLGGHRAMAAAPMRTATSSTSRPRIQLLFRPAVTSGTSADVAVSLGVNTPKPASNSSCETSPLLSTSM